MKTKTQLISKALRIAGKAANTEEVEIRIGKYFLRAQAENLEKIEYQLKMLVVKKS